MPAINHNHLFLIGFSYYLLLPVTVGYWQLFADMPGMAAWHEHFQRLGPEALSYYWLAISGMFLAFYSGSLSTVLLPQLRVYSQSGLRLVRRNKALLLGIAITIGLLITAFMVRRIDLVLTGYRRGYDQAFLGMVATLLMFCTFMAIYLALLRTHRSLSLAFAALAIFCAFVMLSMGARMYALVALIALLIYRSAASKRTRRSLLAIVSAGAAAAVLALGIGLWRVGLRLEPGLALYIFAAEPTFTWFSTSTFLANNLQRIDLLHAPANFFASFVNFVPSVILDNKSDYIIRVSDHFPYESPFGADSIFVSAVGNFGSAGALLYMFCVGFGYSGVRMLAKDVPFFRAYYIMLVALLPFQFFRDNFAILNKQIFWNLLFVPGTVVLLSRLVLSARRPGLTGGSQKLRVIINPAKIRRPPAPSRGS